MLKKFDSPCGTVVRSADDEELVSLALSHAREVRQADLRREQALEMAVSDR